MGFFSSLFGGQNSTLNGNIGEMGSIGSFATKTGESDLSDSSNFFHSILNGGASKVLAPQIGAEQKQGQQQKQTTGMFGNRSGGNNAFMQMTDDNTKSRINDMIAQITGTAASSLGSQGSSLLNAGASAFDSQAKLSQQRMENWSNSILGQSITGAVKTGLNVAGGFIPGV